MTKLRYLLPSLFLAQLLLHVSLVSSFSTPLNGTDKNGCKIGEEFRDGSCHLCEPGTYRFLAPDNIPTRDPQQCPSGEICCARIEPSSDKCLPCPAGTYNPFRGAVSFWRCRPCPVGTKSVAGAAKCIPCPGQRRSSASGSPICASCAPGFFLTKPCTRGVRPKKGCTRCPKGSYSTTRNSVDCKKCPEGMSTARRGATSKTMCKPCGTNGVRCSCRKQGEPWNEVGSYRPIGHAVCTNCPPGTRARNPYATRAEQCKPCPNGTSHVYLEGCKPCRAGTFSFGRGASYCREKRDGKCPFDSFKDFNGVCKLCPLGYKRTGDRCVKCPPGTVSQGYSSTECTRCVFPNVAPQNGGRFCECGRNYFRDSNASFRCMPCPKGTKMDKIAHTESRCEPDCENFPNQDACVTCKDDFERDFRTKKCVPCAEGFTSLDGEERCRNPQTGCAKGVQLAVSASKFGYYLTC